MDQLQQMKNSGSITRDTLVWKGGMAGWEKAGAQQELKGLFTVALPPPPASAAAVPPAPPTAAPPAPPPAAKYHVMVNNQQQGPISMGQLQQMTNSGSITQKTLVWKSGMAGWEMAGAQQELQGLFAVAVPSPPPASVPPAISVPPAPVSSQETNISQSDVNELNSMSDPKSVQSASEDMEDWSESVLRKFKIDDYGENNGKFILFASQSVSLKPTDPQYGDAIVNAFEKAMMKLQEKFVMNRFGKISTDKLRTFYKDRSTHAGEIPLPPPGSPGFSGKLLTVLEKSLDLTDKKLDQELIKLDVDPNELKSLPPTKKKDLFRDKFIKNAIEQASGSIAGLFPIQTNVITDSAGRTVIGVVAIASPKTIQIAKDITLQRKSLIKGKGRDIKSLLPETNEEYIGTLGVRLAYDQDGTPAIISYGIASYRPDTDDDYINDELKADAKKAAVANANAQIAEIINGRMNVKNERKNGEEIRTYVEREMKPNSDTIEKTIKNIIKITKAKASSSATAKLQGISTVKRWRYKAKTGQKFVGAVRVWKYSTLQAVNSFNKPKPKVRPTVGKKRSFQTLQQSSKPVNTIDDF
ncbi:MAG: DUF4339 domain-containing protein [Desulfobacteraceae bacterium]|nr:DUF4339 domain-containing protein [Desulfobacteraceae bacterium]